MMYIKLGLLVFFSSALLASFQMSDNSELILKLGQEAASNGEYQKALDIWESAKLHTEDEATQSPSIGISYIDLATSHNMKGYYTKASDMYYWGLSNCDNRQQETLELELQRLKPIVDQDRYKEWKGYLKNDITKLCSSFKRFWKNMDPTIFTDYNERLVEHWERIAYARKNFQVNRSSVYEADDRAIIYVKLGEPDYKRSNTMRFNRTQVRSWIYDAIDFQFRGGSSGSSSGSDSSSSGGSSLTDQNPSVSSNFQRNRANIDLADRYSKEAEFLHRYREYEIWVYENDSGNRYENPVYIFGQHGDTGFYGMLNSLEEMIPDAAFRTVGSNGSILMPGFLLQLVYYQQVITVDDYFASAFSDLESRLVSPNGLNRSTAFTARSRNINQLNYVQLQAPKQESTYLEEIPDVEIETYQYRHLDEDNNPYLATYIEGQPQKAMVFDQVQTKNYDSQSYSLFFNTKSTDDDLNLIDNQIKRSEINVEGRGDVEHMEPSYAYFEIPHQSAEITHSFTAELRNDKLDSAIISDRAFPENVRAFGLMSLDSPEPLSEDNSRLEMSDLIIGTNSKPLNSDESGVTGFKVRHDRVLEKNTNLMIHFEVYHLADNQASTNKFRVEYQVKPEGRNFFKRLFGGGDKVGLTLNFETLDSYYKTDLEAVTSSFSEGRYELTLKVIEPSTNREVSRSVTFEIR